MTEHNDQGAGLTSREYWILVGAALLAAALLLYTMFLFEQNQQLGLQVNQRAAYIQETVSMAKLNTDVIEVIAALAEQQDDAELKQLLHDHGITYQRKPGAGGKP